MIGLDFAHAGSFSGALSDSGQTGVLADARAALRSLEARTGPGSDYLGWLELPEPAPGLADLVQAAGEKLRRTEALVVVGIGGSYLGARAAIEALNTPFGDSFPVYYAGHQMDARYTAALLERLRGRDYAVNVISKSGTTTEPGLAFRFLFNDLSARYSTEDLRERVVATTDGSRGALRALADELGLDTFVIPDDVGGRFSVLTPVGLLPIAAAGFDVSALLTGAAEMSKRVRGNEDADNPALAYAAYRNACYRAGKKIEVTAAYQEGLHFLAEWWKQLYGESEGKDGKGIFPASVDLTTDLHSMGQWLQDGERTIFETVIDVVGGEREDLQVTTQAEDRDGLNYLAGKSLHEINRTALQATLGAHAAGGVPCLRIELERMDERTLGALFFFYEYACGISAYMLGVNPFDQPGVEAYKTRMFQMLGKPGA